MQGIQAIQLPSYKFWMPLISRQWEVETEIDGAFVHAHGDKISHIWTLIDPVGNSHLVHYNMNKNKPMLTYGWHSLRDFYHLKGECLVTLEYVGGSHFHIQISEEEENQVPYSSFGDPEKRVAGHMQAVYEVAQPHATQEPDKPELIYLSDDDTEPEADVVAEDPGISSDDELMDVDTSEMVPGLDGEPQPAAAVLEEHDLPDAAPVDNLPAFDGDYQCIFTHVLNFDQATGDRMGVPGSVGRYLTTSGVDKWLFIGGSDVEIECEIVRATNDNQVEIGQGWNNFCEVNNVLPLEELTFRFTNPDTRIVYVSY